MAKFTGHTITSDSALGAAKIQRSLRFNHSDDAYFNRTNGTSTSQYKWTFSAWIKLSRGAEAAIDYGELISGHTGNGSDDNFGAVYFYSGVLRFAGWGTGWRHTSRVFRDPNAWYHVMVAVDTTNGTASNRVKMYVNGVEETDFGTSNNPSQNATVGINQNSATIQVGRDNTNSSDRRFDGYMAEVNFIDGQQLDASYFGFTDPVTNIWMPRRYEGTYGNNGFYLDLSDNSSTTALGIDKSPNGNDFTPNNLATGDSTLDSPSNNFATLRHMSTPPSSGSSLSEGDLKFTTGSSGSARNLNRQGISTLLPKSGKWYAEVRVTGGDENNFVGVGPYQIQISPTSNNTRYVYYYGPSGEVYQRTAGSESNASHGAGFGNDDIVGIYIDMDASTPLVYFSKNGQWANGSGSNNQANPTSAITLGNSFFTTDTGGHTGIGIIVSSSSGGSNVNYQANFGQDSTFSGLTTAGGNTDDRGIGDFKYPVPSGALALCSKNLPLTSPSVIRPKKHFDTLLYTGNGSSGHRISGLEFKPDFAWVKRRDSGANHGIYDSVTGVTSYLRADLNNAQDTNLSHLSSFNEDGFTLGADTYQNGNSQTFVAWCWKAGGATTVANTDGDQTTQVSVNEEAGFSIVTYTGTGSNTNIGHGLGGTPDIVITKSRSASGDWAFLDRIGNSTAEYGLFLNDNGGYSSYQGGTYWNDTLPTSTVFRVSSSAATNASGVTYVAYCWRSIPGYSKMGIYRGNGNADGKFVDCGFRPAWLLIKRTNASRNWMLFDNKRDIDNPVQTFLEADLSSADATLNGGVLFLTNGFKCITADTDVNANDVSGGDTYLYMAFAEQPGPTPFDSFPNAR